MEKYLKILGGLIFSVWTEEKQYNINGIKEYYTHHIIDTILNTFSFFTMAWALGA